MSDPVVRIKEKQFYAPETAAGFAPLADDSAAPWLSALRADAFARLQGFGLPTPRLERWKFSNLIPPVKGFAGTAKPIALVYNDPDNLVGRLVDNLSNPQEWLVNLYTQKTDSVFRYGDMMLADLGDAYLRDGLVIDVPKNHQASAPIEITINGEKGFSTPCLVIRLAAGAELTVIEKHEGDGAFWNNQQTYIIIGANAKLRHYRIQENGVKAVYTQNTQITVDRDGSYEGFTLAAGAGFSRHQVHAVLEGENASCGVYGVNTLRGSQHGDTTIEIEHKAGNCNSMQFIRSVLDNQAHGVFQGKVYVHKGADGTDGNQMSNALLLSEGAEMDTKPELEIYADAVQCAHGATTGKLDDEPLFYMRSRGIPEAEARALLIHAFVGEVVDKLGDEAVREMVMEKVEIWLSRK